MTVGGGMIVGKLAGSDVSDFWELDYFGVC